MAGFLLVAFRADPNTLLHLYLLGVFSAFTLSQAGMLRHWHRKRERGWRRSMAIARSARQERVLSPSW